MSLKLTKLLPKIKRFYSTRKIIVVSAICMITSVYPSLSQLTIMLPAAVISVAHLLDDEDD